MTLEGFHSLVKEPSSHRTDPIGDLFIFVKNFYLCKKNLTFSPLFSKIQTYFPIFEKSFSSGFCLTLNHQEKGLYMMSTSLQAIVIEDDHGHHQGVLKTIDTRDLPDYDVLVQVDYSTLNYKDGLAVTGKGKIARRLPMVAGIDLVGTVLESRSSDWKSGDQVIVNGWGLSETEWGGFSQQQRLKAEWLISLPPAFTPVQAMAIGTAGYTAMLSVLALEYMGVVPGRSDREIVVTGAAGGVGSVGVALLSELGYRVAAVTGRPETEPYLTQLGAYRIVERKTLSEKGPSLQKETWAGAIDTAGGHILANVLAQTERHGAVAACGLVGGMELSTTVFPFILRGVSLLGIDSVMALRQKRQMAWDRLAQNLRPEVLDLITSGIQPMSRVPELAEQILQGKIQGRIVIDVHQ